MSSETLSPILGRDPLQNEPSGLVVSEELIRRFNRSGPRYTSYPTADRFMDEFSAERYITSLQSRDKTLGGRSLSLYFHLPFCESLCYFCACNKIITQDHSRSAQYVEYLIKEIEMVSAHLGTNRLVDQLHFGGGHQLS